LAHQIFLYDASNLDLFWETFINNHHFCLFNLRLAFKNHLKYMVVGFIVCLKKECRKNDLLSSIFEFSKSNHNLMIWLTFEVILSSQNYKLTPWFSFEKLKRYGNISWLFINNFKNFRKLRLYHMVIHDPKNQTNLAIYIQNVLWQ
jgi:hypothetical protein